MDSNNSTVCAGPSLTAATSAANFVVRGLAAAMVLCTLSGSPSAQAPSIAIKAAAVPTEVGHGKIESGNAITNSKIAELGAGPDLVWDALEFARRAAMAGLVLPAPRLTGDGEIMFYARRDNLYLDIGVHGDGTYSFYCRDASGKEATSDEDVDIASGIDIELAKVIEAIG